MSDLPTISVVVPTYRRPDMLIGSLRALCAQQLPPLEVLVCYRQGDRGTQEVIDSLSGPEHAIIKSIVLGPDDNFAAGLRAGIAASRGDLVALTDDDSEAPPDWLAQIVGYFEDATLAGVGGRDVLSFETPPAAVVGRMQWFGRMIGNHHTGTGCARDVDFLKGVNCCFRGDLLRAVSIDPRLRGLGNVVHTELSICLPLRRAGWRLVYDPNLTVTHHAAPRKDGDDNHRGGFNGAALRDTVHNETLMVLEHLNPVGRLAFTLWGTLIGTGFTPGVIQALRLVVSRSESPRRAMQRWWAVQTGRMQGVSSYLSSRRTFSVIKIKRPA